ncbi:MAG: iron ABC transporter permease [Variibacter sp.]|nr:iron ABC transporter permease [Variibacter sp.]
MATSAVPRLQPSPAPSRIVIGFERLGGAVWPWLVLGLVTLLVVFPLGALLYGSLRSDSPGAPGATWTLANLEGVWLGLFTDGWTSAATFNSIALAVPVTLAACAIGVFLAWAVTRTDLPGKPVFEMLFLLPMLYSPLIGVIGWSVLADPQAGLLNRAWWSLIGNTDPLATPLLDVYTVTGIIWVMVFYFGPYAFMMNVGTFRAMDPALEEAAAVSGAHLGTRLARITLPMMAASTAAAALFIFTLALEQFAIPGYLGSQIRLDTLAYAIYRRTNAYPNDIAGAAAAGTLLLLLSGLGLWFYRRLIRRSERFVTVTARGYKPAVTELGRLKPLVVAAAVAVILLGSLLPLSAVLLRALLPVRTTGLDLSSLSLENFANILGPEDIRLGIVNSLALGGGAAAICALLGFGMAIALVRRRRWQVSLADYLIAMPIGIPGTVFGVGMLWAYVGTPIYLTFWILLLAFVIRYTVYAVRQMTAGIMQIDRALEEAAVVSGATPLRSFVFVDLPLLRPVIAALALMVFMVVMRELSASIILYGPDSVTLPILTWSYLNDGFYGIASALAIVQVMLVAAVVVLFRWLFGVDVRLRSRE